MIQGFLTNIAHCYFEITGHIPKTILCGFSIVLDISSILKIKCNNFGLELPMKPRVAVER